MNFADPNKLVQSWYVIARSKAVKTDRPKTVDVLNRRITLWRPKGKALVAFDARCPHLGADLGQGKVVDGQLRCAFHHWRFDESGKCAEAPGLAELPQRCTRRYPTREVHGLVWIYNGDSPPFEPPAPPPDVKNFRRLVMPAATLKCHPHLVVGNGLDSGHFGALHNMEVKEPPRLEEIGEHILRLHFSASPKGASTRRLLGLKENIIASFTAEGSSCAWAHIVSPLPLYALFTGRPGPNNSAEMQTVIYLPRGFGLRETRALVLLLSLLHNDEKILERLDFHRGFSDADEAFRRFVERVDAMPTEG